MTSTPYCVYGLGGGEDDICYIGWTDRPLYEEAERLTAYWAGCETGIPKWAARVSAPGGLSLFEIEAASSVEEARSSVSHLCNYFLALGLEVLTEL